MPATRHKAAASRKGPRRRSSRSRQRVWVTPPQPKVTGSALEDVVLAGATMQADLTGSVTAAEIAASRAGAAQLTLTVADPERELLSRGGLLDRDEDLLLDDNLDMELGGVWWRLMGIEPADNGWTLALEDRAAAWLRRHTKHLKVSRGRVTRAQFVHRLYREAGGGIDLYVPELHDRQSIAKADRPSTTAKTKVKASAARSAGGKGWPASRRPTVKHTRATRSQLRVLVGVLEECRRQGCSRRVTIAAVMCVTQESEAGANAGMTGNDDVGLFQQGRPWISVHNTSNPSLSCRAYLLGSSAHVGGTGGVKGWRQVHGSLRNANGDLNRMIMQVQGSVGGYGPWEHEATRTVDLWLNAGGGKGAASEASSKSTAGTPGKAKAYVFERGKDGKREDSLVCCGRLAEEVGWHHWVVQNAGVFASDDELITAPAGLVIHRDDAAVVSGPDWKWDVRHTASQASCSVLVNRLPEPGQVAVIEAEGPASGLWLIDTVGCDLAQPVDTRAGGLALNVALTFVRAQKRKAEPAHGVAGSTTGTDQATKAGSGSSDHGRLRRHGNRVTGGTLRQRIVFAARESEKHHGNYYSRGGAFTVSKGITGEGHGQRSDCSQWIAAMFWAAGAGDPSGQGFKGGYTGTLYQHADKVSKPLPGDLCMYGSPPGHHVELYVGNGKTIGHGSAPVDGGTPRMISDFHGYYRPHVIKGYR